MSNKIKIIIAAIILLLLIIICLLIMRSCNKQATPPAFLYRDSVIETKIDSFNKADDVIEHNKQISTEKINSRNFERKLNQKILTKDYEIIKVSPADSAYSHVIEFLNSWNPDE
jgi:hypothetical protein